MVALPYSLISWFFSSLKCHSHNLGNIPLDEDVLKTSWRRLSSLSSEDVLIKTNMFALALRLQKTSSRRLAKTSSRHLQDVLKMFWRRLQDVLKTSSRRLVKMSSRRLQKRLQDIFKTFWRCLQDVFETSSRGLTRMPSRCFEDVSSG